MSKDDKLIKFINNKGELVPDNEYSRHVLNVLKKSGAIINNKTSLDPEKTTVGIYQKEDKFFHRQSMHYTVPPATVFVDSRSFKGGSRSWGMIDGLIKYGGFQLTFSNHHHAGVIDEEISKKRYFDMIKGGTPKIRMKIKKANKELVH